jgi:hypothetical protein
MLGKFRQKRSIDQHKDRDLPVDWANEKKHMPPLAACAFRGLKEVY